MTTDSENRQAFPTWHIYRSVVVDTATGNDVALVYDGDQGRLIAAAPDLLAALTRWAKWASAHGRADTQGIACDTFAAIAKATGTTA
jgi:hypothetical protein